VTRSAREALIAEALGDMASLLDRLDALKPALAAACEDLRLASEGLANTAEDAEGRVTAIAERATARAVRQIALRAEALVRSAGEAETRAMQTAARELLKAELGLILQRLAVVDHLASAARPLQTAWWTYAATALASGLIAWCAAIFMLGR
jgi:hypothetical protein